MAAPRARQIARLALWPCLALAMQVLLMALALAISRWSDHTPTFCSFRAITGAPCPPCGGTRATIALASGDLLLALRYNPLVTVGWAIAPLAVICIPLYRRRRPFIARATASRVRKVGLSVLALVVLANWVYLVRALPAVEQSRAPRQARASAHASPNSAPRQDTPRPQQLPR